MRRFVALVLITMITGLSLAGTAHADVNDFTVTDFAADYTLSQTDPQGSLTIDERIAVDFSDNNHGIERALPQRYDGQSLQLKINQVTADGTTAQYTTRTDNGNTVLRIGDPDRTVTGQHSYEIKYVVNNVIRFTGDHDELDWNTNGTEWMQPFDKLSARLTIPTSLAAKLKNSVCYTGAQGSTSHDCTVSSAGDTVTFTSAGSLAPGQNLTFREDFPEGIFHKPTTADWWHDHIGQMLWAAGLPLLALLIAGTYWYKFGKDIGGRGTIIPEYGPPAGLRAAEADIIAHYKISKSAIPATIIDLAIRKYLKIEESTTSGMLGIGSHKNYSFTRLTPPSKGRLKGYEAEIMNGLFTSSDTVGMADLKGSFYRTVQSIQKSLPKELTTAGYFSRNPKQVGRLEHVAAVIVAFIGFGQIDSRPATGIGLIVAAVIVAGFASLMPRRTQQGEAAKDAIEGLKLYLNTAEKDRIAMLQSPDAPYASQSGEPVKTVELFETLLPYAMVLGVEKQWARQFSDIYTTPPDWYVGNWNTFNALYLADSLSSSMAAMNNSFAAPSSGGAGGGGGFSGGGGGGGGGGGW